MPGDFSEKTARPSNVGPHDRTVYLLTAAVALATALGVVARPARRAALVDPAISLRAE